MRLVLLSLLVASLTVAEILDSLAQRGCKGLEEKCKKDGDCCSDDCLEICLPSAVSHS